MNRGICLWFGLASLAGVSALPQRLAAQPQISVRPKTVASLSVRPMPNLRVDSNLVLVPVTVCDPMNRPVTGLEREHFRILDNKVEQTITQFAMEDEPLAVGLVFDTSGSMGDKLRRSRMAAAAFFQTANPDDEFFLVEFNDTPKLVVPLTHDAGEIQNQLAFVQSRGRTSLLDAIVLALHEIKKSNKKRKALLIISDGGDNSSRFTPPELRSAVREADVLIYAIGIYESDFARDRSQEEANGPTLLNDIAEQSGGRHLPVDHLAEMPDIAAKIGVELRNRYVIGFSPSDPQRDGKYHHVQVKLVPPHGVPALRAFWRQGYFALGN